MIVKIKKSVEDIGYFQMNHKKKIIQGEEVLNGKAAQH